MRESLNSPREFLLGQLKIFCSFCSWAIIVSQVQMMFLIIPRWGEPNLINSGESIAFKHPLSLTSKRIQSLGLCFKQTPGWCQGCWYEHPLASKMPAETQCLSLFSVDLYLQLKVPVCHCGKVKDEGVWNSWSHQIYVKKRATDECMVAMFFSLPMQSRINKPREWCHPQWLGLPIFVDVARKTPQSHSQKSSSMAILDCARLTTKTN